MGKSKQTITFYDGTIRDRIIKTMNNIDFQRGEAWEDDIEKLEHVVALLQLGKNLDDNFDFVKGLEVYWKLEKKVH